MIDMAEKKESLWLIVLRQLLTFIVIVALCGSIVPWLWKLIAGKDGGIDAVILTSAIYSMLVLFVFIKTRWCVFSRTYLQSRPWAVLTWSALAGAGAIVPGAFIEELLPDMTNVVEAEIQALIGNDYGYFVLCIFAPFVEEAVFRGAILRSLLPRMNSRWAAIAISAALFSLVHMNPAQMPFAFLAGLLLGWMYSRTGSILPGVAYHWINNTIVFVMARVLPPQLVNGGLTDLFGGDHKKVALAVIFSLFILIPSVYQIAIRTKR